MGLHLANKKKNATTGKYYNEPFKSATRKSDNKPFKSTQFILL